MNNLPVKFSLLNIKLNDIIDKKTNIFFTPGIFDKVADPQHVQPNFWRFDGNNSKKNLFELRLQELDKKYMKLTIQNIKNEIERGPAETILFWKIDEPEMTTDLTPFDLKDYFGKETEAYLHYTSIPAGKDVKNMLENIYFGFTEEK